MVEVPPGVRLWLVRHGSTAWSEEGRLCGRSDVPLSPRGRFEVRALRDAATRLTPAGVWSSHLRRARETAELAGLSAVSDERLRELDFGSLEGARWGDLPAAVREAMLVFDAFRAPGGESVSDLARRVEGFLDELAPGLHVLVTHGGVIRLLMRGRGPEAHVAPGGAIRLEAQPAARS